MTQKTSLWNRNFSYKSFFPLKVSHNYLNHNIYLCTHINLLLLNIYCVLVILHRVRAKNSKQICENDKWFKRQIARIPFNSIFTECYKHHRCNLSNSNLVWLYLLGNSTTSLFPTNNGAYKVVTTTLSQYHAKY